MFKFFKNLFGKSKSSKAVSAPVALAEPVTAASVAKVETASLSLLAILERFPSELAATVAKMPGNEVVVVLPLTSILKQLPTGSVKMSLASICRQAPGGTFTSTRMEEKRMVEVPLAEVFRNLRLDVLRRRSDQRMHDLASQDVSGAGVIYAFSRQGQVSEPQFEPAPSLEMRVESAPSLKMPEAFAPPAPAPIPEPAPVTEPAPEPMRVLAPPAGMGRAVSPPPSAPPVSLAPVAPIAPSAPSAPAPSPARMVMSARVAPAPPAVLSAPAAAADEPALILPLSELSAAWPEDVLAEIAALGSPGAKVALPSAQVRLGLSKGKIVFAWGSLRNWISPVILEPAQAREEVDLQLPLRVVAPAFLKSAKVLTTQKRLTVDDSIPALFAGTQELKAPAPQPEPEAAVVEPEAAVVEPEAAVVEPEAAVVEPEAAVVEPEAAVVEPEAAVVEPEAAVVEPEAVVVEPEAVVVEPEAVVVEPEAVVVEPEAAVVEPEAVVVEPEAAVVEPEAVVVEPEAAVVEPEAVVVEPEAAVVEAALLPAPPEVLELPAISTLAEEALSPSSEPAGPEMEMVIGPSSFDQRSAYPADDAQGKQALSDILGESLSGHWSPAEIVAGVLRLPQVAGAVIVLQEGLVVAHTLPEFLKADVVAAFIPQIFSRLNHYADEMKLGALDELLMRTHGSYFQIFHLGFVFFAVLGKPGENLPWNELRLIADELAQHAQK